MGISARRAALDILERCRRSGGWSGAAIDSAIKKQGFDKRDAALCGRLCLGVLENSRLCDFYIGCFYSGRLEPKVRDILRLGVYQIVFLDRVPVSAAVDSSVTLCKDCGCGRASGLVNAVLRRVGESADKLPEPPGEGTAEYLAVRYSHPDWLCRYLVEHYGYDFSSGFLSANNETPELTIQLNTLKLTAGEYTRCLDRAEIAYRVPDAPENCLALKSTGVTELPGFEEGLFYVQDRAARLAVCAAEPMPGMRVLDACASPGGKSFAAAIAMENRGSITACDIHEKKLGLVNTGARRLGIDIIETRQMDARVYQPDFDSSFDLVIADVPCSGFGVIAKKPEIRCKTMEDIAGLPEIQRAIIDNLSRYVRPGGVLLYATCTVLQEENQAIVEGFLKKHSGFKAESFPGAENGMRCFWPHIDGTDGFFAARLRRTD